MKMLDSNSTLWAWPRVQANVSTINFRLKMLADHYIERAFMINLLKKNASILRSLMKNQVFSVLELVMCAVTLLAENITRGI